MPEPIKTNRLTPQFSWDSRLRPHGGYRDSRGRIVRQVVVLEALESVIETTRREMQTISRSLADGEITLAQWQLGMRDRIRTVHIASAALAKGGWAQMSAADWGFVGSQIKAQLRFLRKFALEIESGKASLHRLDGAINGNFLQRVDLYGNSGITTYHNVRRREARAAGYNREARRLDPNVKQHCACCVSQARRGYQPIGILIPIGGCECTTKCRCRFVFGKEIKGKIIEVAF